jgi:hypothetical protein
MILVDSSIWIDQLRAGELAPISGKAWYELSKMAWSCAETPYPA